MVGHSVFVLVTCLAVLFISLLILNVFKTFTVIQSLIFYSIFQIAL